MTNDKHGIPHYFKREEDGFKASGLSRSPWHRDKIAGGPLSALLAAIGDEAGFDPGFDITRFTVDILGAVPHAALLTPRVTCLRAGRQMQVHRVEILAGETVTAQAHFVLAREAETPAVTVPSPYPSPDSLAEDDFMASASMAGAIKSKRVHGAVRQPGPAAAWLSCDGEIILGTKPSQFVKAALFADFGSGMGSVLSVKEWSYANLDISLHLLRMPVGDWFLIDAHSETSGNGHGVARTTFADAEGIYAYGTQTMFIAPQ